MKKILITLLSIILIIPACNKNTTPVPPDEKIVYLTFDDGPSPVTLSILETLKANSIKATFFVIGSCVEKYPEILKQTLDCGHSVGIHSYSHNYKEIYANPQALQNDITLCFNAIRKVKKDFTTSLYRFPGGSFNLSQPLKTCVENMGLKYYDWNASTQDAELKNYTPDDLIQACINTSYSRKKIILLSHDAGSKTRTAQALQGIIDYYKNNGYVFKSL